MLPLRIKDLTLGYGSRVVLRQVSLEVGPGQVLGILGPNGSGKTTLLAAVSGVLRPWAGEISLNGQSLPRMSRLALARLVAVVPQNPSLPAAFTALEIALMGRYPHLGFLRFEGQKDLALAWEALEKTGMEHLAQRLVGQLSGGERQRLVIARALAQEPQLLLLDEPLAHLDLQHQLETIALVQDLARRGLSTLVAMHDLTQAARFCQRLALLKDGSIRAQGLPEEVLTPENIEAAFGVEALVYPHLLSGHPVIDPIPRRPRAGRRVHIIGGGGKAARIMQALHAEGFRLSIGVLNEGDTDLAAARALGVPAVAIPAFSGIDGESYQHNLELIADAELVVVAEVPFGWANLLNLKAAAQARRLLLLEETPIQERDFTGGSAAALYLKLKAQAIGTTPDGLLPSVRGLLGDGPD